MIKSSQLSPSLLSTTTSSSPFSPPTISSNDLSEICLHNLVAIDISPLTQEDIEKENLKLRSKNNCLTLIAKIQSLPFESSDEGRLTILDAKPAIGLPRSQPIPTPKPPTRWERFAKENSIQKKKRSRKVWDDISNDWKPRWGHGSVKKVKQAAEEAIFELRDAEDFNKALETRRSEALLLRKKQQLREIRNKVEAKQRTSKSDKY